MSCIMYLMKDTILYKNSITCLDWKSIIIYSHFTFAFYDEMGLDDLLPHAEALNRSLSIKNAWSWLDQPATSKLNTFINERLVPGYGEWFLSEFNKTVEWPWSDYTGGMRTDTGTGAEFVQSWMPLTFWMPGSSAMSVSVTCWLVCGLSTPRLRPEAPSMTSPPEPLGGKRSCRGTGCPLPPPQPMSTAEPQCHRTGCP